MADIVFVNNASSLLAASINNLDTVIQVSSGDGALFPVFTAPEFFVATLEDDAGNIEIVQCTGRVNDLLTVVRGFDNSVAQSFAMSTTRVELRLTAVVVEEFLQRSGDIMTGDLDMNQNELVDAKLTGPNTQMLAGEIVNVPLRGLAAASGNEIAVPIDGTSRATAGGANIRVAGDDLTGDVASATESAEGIAELADQTEMDAGTDDTRIVTPKKFADTKAEEADGTDPGHFGVTRFATTAEVEADVPTADDAAISPARLDEKLATEDRFGVAKLASQAEVDAGTDAEKIVTPATLTAAAGLASGRRGALATHTVNFESPNTGGTNPFPTNPEAHPFNTTVFDSVGVDEIHNDSVFNTRLTVPSGSGITAVRLTAGCTWEGDTGGLRHMQFRKNGGVGGIDPSMGNFKPFSSSAVGGSAGIHGTILVSPIIAVAEDDYFEIFIETQAAATPTDTLANNSWFEMEVIE